MKSSCPHCGNNPVPHLLYWQNETLNILLTPLRQKILYNPATRFVKRNGLDGKIFKVLLTLAEALRIVRRRNNIELCKVPRAKVLWQDAPSHGIKMSELLLFGKPFDTYVASKDAKKIVFSGLPRPFGYTNKWLDLMDDKWLFKKLMMENSLPVPKGGSVSSFQKALEVFSQIQKPVIVKPRAGSRGRHSTTFVSTTDDLKKAFKIAKKLCHWVIVEEQLLGPVYRATLVNFELCGVLRGDAPQVAGGGARTVGELIKMKNQNPHPGVKDIVVDAGMEKFLLRQDLKLDSVLEKGRAVSLSEKIGVNYGGSSSEDFEICHPDNKELFVKAAVALGDPIVGFDFIIPDIAKSFKEQKCGFLEVNSLPFINLHHDPLLGTPRNVAEKVWKMAGF